MEFEVFKKSHLKRNIIIVVLVAGIIVAVVLNFTRAKFRTTQSIPLVNGTINYELSDLNLIGVYIQGDDGYIKSDTIPESGYELNEEESYCTVNGEEDTNISVSYDMDTKLLTVTPMTTKGTKCYLYFDEESSIAETLLVNYPMQLTRSDFSTVVTNTTTGTIYYADTSKGRTYYFAGNPTDNWVYFGGFYWRIIRINEDGTIRMIYQGTSANTTGTGTQIGVSAFNSDYNDNMYVGYMYQNNQLHGLTSSSSIKGVLDEWYQNNLISAADKIDGNAGFCGDRIPTNGTGLGMTYTEYAAYSRLDENEMPSFECQNESDLYTTNGSIIGNGALMYPISLITIDEAWYAGGVMGKVNRGYYLYTYEDYWTISPSWFNGTTANVLFVSSIGNLLNWDVDGSYGVRPVINLKANITISSGNGTASSPYIVN